MEELTPGAQTAAAPPAPAPVAATPQPAIPAPPAPPAAQPLQAAPAPAPAAPVAAQAPAPEPIVPPATPQQPTVTMPVGGAGVTMAPAAQAELDPSWPIAGYTGPQPWQVQNPPALSHNRGFVVSGTAGDLVEELAAALARLGYETAISRGENPQAIFAESERAAVIRFQTDFGIKEDPAVLAVTTPDTVGPWTWEALFRLLRRVAG